MKIARKFTTKGQDAYAGLEFRTLSVQGGAEITAPANASPMATELLVQRFFSPAAIPAALRAVAEDSVPTWLWQREEDSTALADLPTSERSSREQDSRQIYDRIAGCWSYWGWKAGYFDTEEDARAFYDELRYMMAAQIALPDTGIPVQSSLLWAYGMRVNGGFAVDSESGELTERSGPVASTPSAANGAIINLLPLRSESGEFDIDGFAQVARLWTIALELATLSSHYASPAAAQQAFLQRPLALSMTNLAALIMASGYAYDSQEARAFAGAITALLSGLASITSAEMAEELGACPAYAAAAPSLHQHMQQQRNAAYSQLGECPQSDLTAAARLVWDQALDLMHKHGLRNLQLTAISAQLEEISLLLDAETTGPAPELVLVKHRALMHGGLIKRTTSALPDALRRLGYTSAASEAILTYAIEQDMLEGSPEIQSAHLSVFDCISANGRNGQRALSWQSQLLMYAAIQPFLQSPIARTITLPYAVDAREALQLAETLGLTACSFVRESAKAPPAPESTTPPPSLAAEPQKPVVSLAKATAKPEPDTNTIAPAHPQTQPQQSFTRLFMPTLSPAQPAKATRVPLPARKRGYTQIARLAGHDVIIRTGEYADGRLGEISCEVSSLPPQMRAVLASVIDSVNIGLQHGVPLAVYAKNLRSIPFEPAGAVSGHDSITSATSVLDYLFTELMQVYADIPVSSTTSAPSRALDMVE